MKKYFQHYIITITIVAVFMGTAYGQAVAPSSNTPSINTPYYPPATYPGLKNMPVPSAYNYVRSYTPDQPVNAIDGTIYHRQTTDYYDGLGRLLQTVQQRGHADGHDIIRHHIYDAVGRESYQYLPYAVTNTYSWGQYHPHVLSEIMTFYQNSSENLPYSKIEYDNSPLNRVTKQMGEGAAWVGSGRGVKISYGTNEHRNYSSSSSPQGMPMAGNYPHWVKDSEIGHTPYVLDFYEDNVLFKTTIIDEDGKESDEFKDKLGRVIWKRTLINNVTQELMRVPSDYANTFYVYDDLSRLICVIPPEAVTVTAVMTVPQPPFGISTYNVSWIVNERSLDNLCYQYKYDERGRLIEKKIPGKAVEYYVYDERDRLVYYQDGNMRGQGVWQFTIYDAMDRPLEQGLIEHYGYNRLDLAEEFNHIYWVAPSSIWNYVKNYSLWHTYPTSLNNAEIFTQTYYDDYSEQPSGFNFDNTQFPIVNQPYLVQPVKSSQTRGLVTWTKTRVLNYPEETWITTVNYYDGKGRLIQTQSNNLEDGIDIVSNIYYFQGMLWKSITRHQNPNAQPIPGATDALTTITLDNTFSRNLSTTGGNDLVWERRQKINNGINYELAYYDYNHLGQIRNKQFTVTNVNYDYNIRGWLNQIDATYFNSDDPVHYFKENIYYESGFVSKLYNGNIAGITWSNQYSGLMSLEIPWWSQEGHAYGYSYDKLNRLTWAEYRNRPSYFNQLPGTPTPIWSKERKDYTVSNISYDLNGNITSMTQRHPGAPDEAPITMDALTYKYSENSNQLRSVTDEAPDEETSMLPDFKDGITEGNSPDDQEYEYDLNGNLTYDRNKETFINYNYINKPFNIKVLGKGDINYYYDATGTLLKKVVTPSEGDVETYEYMGNFVYKNNVLQYVLNEEGRARPVFNEETNGVTKFVCDYFIKDHLGNVRSTVTAKPSAPNLYLALHEIASANIEQLLFDNIPAVRDIKPGSTNPEDLKAAHLVADDETKRIGTAIMLRVMPGDKFTISAKSYYDRYERKDKPLSSEAVVSSLLNTMMGGSTYEGVPLSELPDNMKIVHSALGGSYLPEAINNIPVTNATENAPKAYLNALVFDKDFKLVTEQSHRVQVLEGGISGSWTAIEVVFDGPIINGGYMIVYINNEDIGNDVWFDDLNISHYSGGVLEENFYYPYGLCISNEAAGGIAPNPYKYQGIELEKHFGLEQYETFYRGLDPYGSFHNIDPKAEADYSISPYAAMRGNPAFYTDPMGDCPDCPTGAKMGDVFQSQEWSGMSFTYNENGEWATGMPEVTIYSGDNGANATGGLLGGSGPYNISQAAQFGIGYNADNFKKHDDISKLLVGMIATGLTPLTFPAVPTAVSSYLANPVAWNEFGGSVILGSTGYAGELTGTGAAVSKVENAAAKGGMQAEYTFTKSAGKHLTEMVQRGENAGQLARPYMRSPLTIQEIMSTGKGTLDATFKGGMNWRVPGAFRGSQGIWELGINPETNVIYHFNFTH